MAQQPIPETPSERQSRIASEEFDQRMAEQIAALPPVELSAWEQARAEALSPVEESQ